MVMRFSSGRIGHRSSTQTTAIDDACSADDSDDEPEEVEYDVPNDNGDVGPEEVESDEEIDYGYANEDDDEERDEGDDENGDDVGPEDGEEAWEEDDILELEGYADL